MAAVDKLPYDVPTYNNWSQLARFYHPLQAGSIDGTDLYPHDKAIWRAMHAKYKPNKKITGNPKCTLFVGRLNKDTLEATVEKKFLKYGDIKKCRLIRDIVTGFSKGYAFIEYENERDAKIAYREMHKADIDGREIIVEYELERNLEGWIPRRLGGGFGGQKESGQLRFGGRDRGFKRPLPVQALGQGNRFSENTERTDNTRDDRERSSHRDRDRRQYRDRYRDRDSGRDRDRFREKYRERDRERDRDRDRSRHRNRDSNDDRLKNDSPRQDRHLDEENNRSTDEYTRGYDKDRHKDRHRERSRWNDDYKRKDKERRPKT